MNITDLQLAATPLRKGEILRLGRAQGNRVEVLAGSVWLTIDDDPRDLVLEAGEGFTIDRPGEALVSALRHAQLIVLAPLPLPAPAGPQRTQV